MRTGMIALRTELRRRWEFDGNPRNLIIGALSAVAFTLGANTLQAFHVWESGFGPPLILLAGFVARQLGMRSGLVCAAVSTVLTEWLIYDVSYTFTLTVTAKISLYACIFGAAVLFARSPIQQATRVFDRGPDLPFTSRRNGPEGGNGGIEGSRWVYWDVSPTGRADDDLHLGTEYLRILAERARSGEPYPLLPWIIHDMVKAGRWSEIERGFSSALGRLALRRSTAPGEPPPQSQE